MNLTREQIDGFGTALNEATLLGIDVDQQQRIAEVTLDVLSLPESGPAPKDNLVRMILAPIGKMVASLRHGHWNDPDARVEPFSIDQILDVVQRFGGQSVYGDEFFDQPDTEFSKWSNRLSLDYQAGTDGCEHTLDLFQEGDKLHLDVRVWFDDLTVKTLDGEEISVDEFIANGKRWWEAFYKKDPRTQGKGIFPIEDS